MRVIVTRPAAEAAEWVEGLRSAGFAPVALPLIQILPAGDARALQDAWLRITHYRAAMFVSANAVRGFFAAAPAATAFGTRAWATGAGTLGALLAAGVARDRIDAPPADAPRFDSEALWDVVQAQAEAGARVLLVRGADAGSQQPAGREWLEQRLLEKGARPEAVVAYVRACPKLSDADREWAARAASDGSAWLFSSSQAIANLQAQLPGVDWSRARAVATHPRIADAARAAGFAVVRVSRPPLEAVVADLESLG
ncbi:uroporphyrinogen-III synthase [Ramlibacter sp. PS4R-6]|uniref:uroporphyrinogen-III synthase n=1 Tax=Ramlibacter sp. PS4R-6 TaxID=3133438 RepID=UPI0030986ED4